MFNDKAWTAEMYHQITNTLLQPRLIAYYQIDNWHLFPVFPIHGVIHFVLGNEAKR